MRRSLDFIEDSEPNRYFNRHTPLPKTPGAVSSRFFLQLRQTRNCTKVSQLNDSMPKTTPLHRRTTFPQVAILVDTASTWGREIVRGIVNYAHSHGRWNIFAEARGAEETMLLPRGWNGDGVIARVSNAALGRQLRSKKIPVVNVSSIELPEADFPRVCTDLNASARLAADHFLDRGFRHFAYFSLSGLSYVARHQQAFVEAVKTAGGDFASLTVKSQAGAEPDWRLDLLKLGAWVKSLPKPIGILCWNASSAREIVFACQEVGLQVPEEVAVLSQSDDDVLCEVPQVQISGVRAAANVVGFQAARLLERLMRGNKPPRQPLLIKPLSITARQSTDCLALQDPALVKALGFIRLQATLPVLVSDVARHAGVSRRVLERKFLEVLRRTPAQELRRHQLDRARQLLIETDLPMSDVAEKSGFGSQAYLSAVFSKCFQQSPLCFRREAHRTQVG
jgi:LacI family transcriptional regulator